MRRYQLLLVGIDGLAALTAIVVAFVLRFALLSDASMPSNRFYAAIAVLAPLAWVACVAANSGYKDHFVGVGSTELNRLTRAGVHFAAVSAVVAWATGTYVSRGFVLLALPIGIVLDLAGRCLARAWLHSQRRRGRAVTSVLAIGNPTSVAVLSRLLDRDRHAAMTIVAAALPSTLELLDVDTEVLDEVGVPIVGTDENLAGALATSGAGTVVVLSGELSSERLRRIAWQLEDTPISLVVSPGLAEVGGALHVQSVAGLPLLHVEPTMLRGFAAMLKHLFDRLTAAAALVILLPLFAAVAVVVKLDSPGPVLFLQTRVGRDGRLFRIVKFRSMRVDAEDHLAELQDHNEHGSSLLFKIRNDPRVTRAGRYLRRYSLDELPQLINVVRGDMSLVGPRPPLPSEVAGYGDDHRRRLLVKPGLTGLSQVSGRSDLGWDQSVHLDLRYVENWSLGLDARILARTVSAVIRSSGAY
ncbi:MAG TPA: sugar transferase [Jatrophihabitans sp.]|jgi:exopolysaccharide biosynthesis polyprenyl glycosylphosphotransferase|uniref:sugar transferase n=1 Tax=Jatrophihabitans sp. TaxID=1932789 RepID=UPI002E08DF10|nr:sugar transferase [Jatrophihabitans sp.]